MATGKVKMYNADKGFGFLIPDVVEEDLFMHITEVTDKETKPVEVGQLVRYETTIGRNGKPVATKVIRLDDERM